MAGTLVRERRLLLGWSSVIVIDDRHWPLVLYRFSGSVSLSELDDYLRRQDAMLARKQLTGSIVLTGNVKMWELPVLRRQADWIKANADLLRRYSVGVAMVIQSPLVRGMLKALLWMQPMPQPHILCSDAAEGLRWLRARFLTANVSIEIPTDLV
jgi:hypothetical protein